MQKQPLRLLLAFALLVGSAAAQALTGAGATFPYPLYSKWFSDYNRLFPQVEINYQSIGSGGGIRQLTEGTVDFGASDGPMTDEQLSAYRAKHRFGVLHFPAVLGAEVPAYNLPEVSAPLNFTSEVLAGIFLGTITRWNAAEIAGANPGVRLPASDIIVVHRSDGSGTTYCWTDYLSKVSPEWHSRVGKGTSVNWPVGLGAKGNEGVAGFIRQTPHTIGYLELVYAIQNKLAHGKIRNREGRFVEPGLANLTAAAAAIPMPDDFRISITDAPGPDSYPISTFTWLLLPERIEERDKRRVLVDFLNWMLTHGQPTASKLFYAPLPRSVVLAERKQILKIH